MINGLSVSPLHKGVKCPEYCNEEKSSVEQTAKYFHCRVPSAKGHHREFIPDKSRNGECSVFLDAAFLCMDPNYDAAGFNFVVTPSVTLCSSHHPPTDCWHPLSSTISPFPRDWGAFREEFHPRGTSMEWLTWKIFLVQKCNLYIYFTKDRVTNNLICACTGVW